MHKINFLSIVGRTSKNCLVCYRVLLRSEWLQRWEIQEIENVSIQQITVNQCLYLLLRDPNFTSNIKRINLISTIVPLL